MAVMHGSAAEVNSGKEEWDSYVERLEHYFVANSVSEPAKKCVVLLSCCGAETYKLIRNLVAPEKPTMHSFKQLTELVQCHYNPKPSAIEPTYRDGVPVEYGSLFGKWSWNFETKGGEV